MHGAISVTYSFCLRYADLLDAADFDDDTGGGGGSSSDSSESYNTSSSSSSHGIFEVA